MSKERVEQSLKVKEVEFVIKMGQNFLKTGLLISGGAAIAALAYMGDSAQKSNDLNPLLKYSIAFFAASVLFIAIASALAHLSQHDTCNAQYFITDHCEKKIVHRRAKRRQNYSYISAFISCLLFISGCVWMVFYL